MTEKVVAYNNCAKLLALLLVLQVGTTESQRTLDRCSLAIEMYRLGTPRSDLAKWVYAVKKASGFRTDLVTGPDANGYRFYGLFQFCNRFWCKPSSNLYSRNLCDVDCTDLLTDNIEASVRCALLVKNMKGEGWQPWHMHLDDYDYSGETSVEDCFENEDNEVKINETDADGVASGSNAEIQFLNMDTHIKHAGGTHRKEL